VPYSVPVGDPSWGTVHRSEVLFAMREYAAQKEEADELLDAYVASLMVKERADGTLASVTVWGQGVDTLLPCADFVAVVSEDYVSSTVPWETVARVVDLVPEPGWAPVRYRVRVWPDPSMIERLRAADTSL
jgi:hypothetical protein